MDKQQKLEMLRSLSAKRREMREGAALLAKKLAPLGFKFELTDSGAGSGGVYAEGRFTCGDRSLWLSLRYGLGLVGYSKGQLGLSHSDFMRAVGKKAVARYPSTLTEDRMAGFRDLLADLEYCGPFLEDEGDAFVSLAQHYDFPSTGFHRLAEVEAEIRASQKTD